MAPTLQFALPNFRAGAPRGDRPREPLQNRSGERPQTQEVARMNYVETTHRPSALGLTGKVVRLRERLRDPEWRRYGYLLMGGKMLGVAMLLGIVALLMNVMGSPAQADDAVLKGNDIVNPINTVWTLMAAFLVVRMQPGNTIHQAGFSRPRGPLSKVMEDGVG